MERLQKVIAHAGIASRRKAEELIMQGRISVNGVKIDKLGKLINGEKDTIEIDGKPINKTGQKLYLMLNKPAGYTCTRAHFFNEKSLFLNSCPLFDLFSFFQKNNTPSLLLKKGKINLFSTRKQ